LTCPSNSSTEKTEALQQIQKLETQNDPATCKQNLHDQLLDLEDCIHKSSDIISTLHEVSRLITSALNIFKLKQKSTKVILPTSSNLTPNKTFSGQRPFHSTKRKRTSANVQLA